MAATTHASSESDLLLAYRRDRSADAFEQLIRLHQAKVRGILYNIVLNQEDADDLAQLTWLTVHETIERFRGSSSFSTWVCGIAVKKAMQFQRNHQNRRLLRETHQDFLPRAAETSSPDDLLMSAEESLRVDSAMEALSPSLRAAFTLSVIENMPATEIARICACSVPMVHWRLHRARRKLAENLKNETHESH